MNRIILVLIFLMLGLSANPLCADVPVAAQKEIDQLVQQDKFTEALAKVAALLKDEPADKDLLDLKAQLEKSTKHVACLEKPAVSKLEMAEIKMIYKDAMAQPEDSPERAKFMRELLDKSAPLVKRDEKLMDLWAARGQAALDLNRPLEGNDAATHLMNLGAAESDNESLVVILASLKRKGWLDANEAQKASEAEARKDWWVGEWTGKANWKTEIVDKSDEIRIKIQKKDSNGFDAQIWHQYEYDSVNHRLWTTVTFQVPGEFSGDSYKGGRFSGKCKLGEVVVSGDGNQLKIRYHTESETGYTQKREIIATRNEEAVKASVWVNDEILEPSHPVLLQKR